MLCPYSCQDVPADRGQCYKGCFALKVSLKVPAKYSSLFYECPYFDDDGKQLNVVTLDIY